jgi:peptide deformylase
MTLDHSHFTQPPDDGSGSVTPDSADDFIADLKHWRDVRGLSQKRLAAQMAYDPSYISKIEGGQQQPTPEFARRADDVLRAGGSLIARAHDFRSSRPSRDTSAKASEAVSHAHGLPQSLIVRHEEAECAYLDRAYHMHIRRQLQNASDSPVTRYLIRISVDRHPKTPERSNELYRERPLAWEEIDLRAWCLDEPLAWEVKHDRDAFKEVWILFENEHRKLPLYPGETTWIEYRYTVGADKWGQWFQRAIRLPTRRLTVHLVFPASLEPVVWGTETTMTAESVPVRTAISQREEHTQRIFSWTTDNPPLHARYRFEWLLGQPEDDGDTEIRPSERMRRLGIVQANDPALRHPTEPFELPRENEVARGVGELLTAFLHPLRAAHAFGKGMGLAAPQIGIGRAAALVQLADEPPLVLYNPRIIDASSETDEQYEGCLSFFDVRGNVERSLQITVEHTTLDGTLHILTLERGAARLWAHEIDHLQGILYTDRMAPDTHPIPIERYRSIGKPWDY